MNLKKNALFYSFSSYNGIFPESLLIVQISQIYATTEENWIALYLFFKLIQAPQVVLRALKKVPVFGKTNKKAASYCTSEQFSDGQILSLFCLTQWLRYLYNDLQRVI